MEKFEISDKIVWRGLNLKSPEDSFYPSFYKEISKKRNFFKENFDYEFVDADIDKLKEIFFPLYEKEIISREDYTLDRKKILSDLENKISSDKIHKFLFIRSGNELVYALLFSLKNEGLYFGYRVLKRNIDKTLLRKATVSYWAEELVFEFGKQHGATFFSRGKDSHPYSGRKRLGLPLFKLKTGMKPRKPLQNTPHEILQTSKEYVLNKKLPYLFFSGEDNEGFYRICNLYYPEGSLEESFVNEFDKVVTWSGLEFNNVQY